jgi:hypothetical protein
MEIAMAEGNPLYDERSAATYIGGLTSPLSVRTMQRWRFDGAGPAYLKIGRLVRYRKSDLDRFLEDCARRPTVKFGRRLEGELFPEQVHAGRSKVEEGIENTSLNSPNPEGARVTWDICTAEVQGSPLQFPVGDDQ